MLLKIFCHYYFHPLFTVFLLLHFLFILPNIQQPADHKISSEDFWDGGAENTAYVQEFSLMCFHHQKVKPCAPQYPELPGVMARAMAAQMASRPMDSL